jgi:hypothetical protein
VTTWQSWLASYNPLHYQVADAQNLIVRQCIQSNFQWLLLIEHDNVLPPDAFIRFNEYIQKADTPIVSGLYYTRAQPSEPLVFRGRGNSTYRDFRMGDLVWCDGVPTGTLLIHAGVLRAMWDESPEYLAQGNLTRRVFVSPSTSIMDEKGDYHISAGTSDLNWCDRIIKGDYLRKAGWNDFVDEHEDMPFLVDTNIFTTHIEQDGMQYPPNHQELRMQLAARRA